MSPKYSTKKVSKKIWKKVEKIRDNQCPIFLKENNIIQDTKAIRVQSSWINSKLLD